MESAEYTDEDGKNVPGWAFAYSYDEIGNITRGGRKGPNGYGSAEFGATDLNVHETRQYDDKFQILGTVATGTTVRVNGQPVLMIGTNGKFLAELTLASDTESYETNVVIQAVRFDSSTSKDVVAASTGSIHVAASTESPDNENRGVTVSDSRMTYHFDHRSYLRWLKTTNMGTNYYLQFEYYPDGKRASKRVSTIISGVTNLVETRTWVYDGWNPVFEGIVDHATTSSSYNIYLWGPDVAGQVRSQPGHVQAAGGVGGLLAIITSDGKELIPLPDHNGNVQHLFDANTKEIIASYEYSPFGVPIKETGDVELCKFRTQTKYYDVESGLLYYGMRYYDPRSGKWLSRDPLGEAGGLNMFAWCRNDGVNKYDVHGAIPVGHGGAMQGVKLGSDGRPVNSGSVIHDTRSGTGAAYTLGELYDWEDTTQARFKRNRKMRDTIERDQIDTLQMAWGTGNLAHSKIAFFYGLGGLGLRNLNEAFNETTIFDQRQTTGDRVGKGILGTVELGTTAIPVAKGLSTAGRFSFIAAEGKLATGMSFRQAAAITRMTQHMNAGPVLYPAISPAQSVTRQVAGLSDEGSILLQGERVASSAGAAGDDISAFHNGMFSVLDWRGYPAGLPKPSGPFVLLEGAEYETARKAANSANRAMHRADDSLKGLQIHEVHPVKFGGSPTDPLNKVPLTPQDHSPYTVWWNSLMRYIQTSGGG